MAKIGEQLGGWTLRELLDKGGQGDVFAATKKEGGQEVAIKVVKVSKAKKRARFLQEIAIHAALSSQQAPNIIPVLEHNLEELEGGGVRGFIVMPLAKTNLRDQRDTLVGRIELCLEIFVGILQGVKAAHAAGVVHRDIKPNNILFLDFSLRNPLISDFGICLLRQAVRESRVTEIGETVGAKFFMAPEQERGEVVDIQPNADLYALGKLLHHMLTGRLLYREELNKAFTEKEFATDRRYKLIFERVLARTIVEAPENRIQTVDELIEVIKNIQRGNGGDGGKGGEAEPAPQGPSSGATANKSVAEFRYFAKEILSGTIRPIGLLFDELASDFDAVWSQLHDQIKTTPGDGRSSAKRLIQAQPTASAVLFAIARCDANDLFSYAKRFIERILRSSENQSGYPAVFTVPHVQAGYYYMGMSTVALAFESWSVLRRLLLDKFEWYYQSGRPIFTRGFAMSYFFHPEALGRAASETHNFYRETLEASPIVKDIGLTGDQLLNTYLQVQFLMSLKGAQMAEAGEEGPLWPDFGRFHGYRITPFLDRMYYSEDYAEKVLPIFGESKEEFFGRLNTRIGLLSNRMRGGNYFWDSLSSWEPRSVAQR